MMHIYDAHICAYIMDHICVTYMLKLDVHFESYMCPYVCFLHTYDLHVYDPLHVYDDHICAFRHMTLTYDPLSRCDGSETKKVQFTPKADDAHEQNLSHV